MKMKLDFVTSILFFISGCMFLTNSIISTMKKDNPIVICCEHKESNKLIDSTFKSEVYNEILNQNIQFPEVVMQQAILESGGFTSNIFKRYNNCFGFHNGKSYLKFPDLKSCIIYYRFWQNKHYQGGNYYIFLKEYGYAQDSTYIDKLKRVKI